MPLFEVQPLKIIQSPRVNEISSEYPAVKIRALKFDVCRRKKILSNRARIKSR